MHKTVSSVLDASVTTYAEHEKMILNVRTKRSHVMLCKNLKKNAVEVILCKAFRITSLSEEKRVTLGYGNETRCRTLWSGDGESSQSQRLLTKTVGNYALIVADSLESVVGGYVDMLNYQIHQYAAELVNELVYTNATDWLHLAQQEEIGECSTAAEKKL